MANNFLRRVSYAVSFAALAVLGCQLSAHSNPDRSLDVQNGYEYHEQPTVADQQVVTSELMTDEASPNLASVLRAEPSESSIPETAEGTAPTVAQGALLPGRATRSGPSYIGIAGNLGLTGETAMSRGNFAVISKIGLTRNLSVRPSAVIGDNTVFLIPVTADFPLGQLEILQELGVAPYIGGGVAISTGDDSRVRPMVSGGVDLPLSPQFTATAGVNAAFLRETEVGLVVGVGYAF